MTTVYCYFTDSTLTMIRGVSPVSVLAWAQFNDVPYAEIDESDSRYVAFLAAIAPIAEPPSNSDIGKALAIVAANAGLMQQMPASIQALAAAVPSQSAAEAE